MPYDPTKPANNSPIVAAELRDQFAGLNAAIQDRVPYVDFYDGIYTNSSGPVQDVSSLSFTVSDPPTQAEVQTIADKLDEILLKLKRA
jgi:hypothetical protein